MRKLSLILFGMLVTSSLAIAAIEQVEFDSPKLHERYKSLISELRCVVCQNQNLADSDAPLAKDLRTIAADMLREGASDEAIKTFMRERYGDFVLYNPPFNAWTAFLWLGPIIVLLAVLAAIFIHIRRRQQDELLVQAHRGNDAQQIKVRNLLRDSKIDSEDEHT